MPRLLVLLAERGQILSELVEKSDRFAQTLVASGTFGFLPGRPSGYTQPLYAWFLAGLYQVFERHWLVVGVAHIAVAAVTAVLVLEIGRRVASLEVGVVGATIATLHPFLVWHDLHVNREILDGLLLALVTLLALIVGGAARLARRARPGRGGGPRHPRERAARAPPARARRLRRVAASARRAARSRSRQPSSPAPCSS